MGTRTRRPVVGQPGEPFEGVEQIAVLRGGGLGDLLFALPAVTALAETYPDAEITLLGTPMHAALLSDRPGPVTSVEVLPVSEGVRAGGPEDPLAREEFMARMQSRRLDLAVQVHGGGRFSNPFLLELGARHTVGTRTPDAAPLERNLAYVYYQHEVLRALEVVGLAGAVPVDLEPYVELTEPERAGRAEARRDGRAPLLLIHPGATDPRRRWPAEAFGDVAAAVAGDGTEVLVIGDESDVAAAGAIVDRARRLSPGATVCSVAGQVQLGELVGLLARGTVLLANDSGPRHLAQAVGTATVGVYWFGNVINAQPFSRARHRIHMSWTTRCPVCGRDCTQVGWRAERCEHDDSFVADVAVEDVLADVCELLGR